MRDAPHAVLAFDRSSEGQQLRAYFNVTAEPCAFAADLPPTATPVNGHGLVGGEFAQGVVRLPPYGVLFVAH